MVTKLFVKRAPSFASRSRCGVWFTFEPYAEMACCAWSSEKMKRMFGRRSAAKDECGMTSDERRAVRRRCFMMGLDEDSRSAAMATAW